MTCSTCAPNLQKKTRRKQHKITTKNDREEKSPQAKGRGECVSTIAKTMTTTKKEREPWSCEQCCAVYGAPSAFSLAFIYLFFSLYRMLHLTSVPRSPHLLLQLLHFTTITISQDERLAVDDFSNSILSHSK